MSVKEVDGVRIEDGTGTVTTIERRQKNAQVSLDVQGLKFAVTGWLEIGALDVIEGDTVTYEIHKGEDGYRRYVKLARSELGKAQSDQAPEPEPPSAGGRDDVQAGDSSNGPVPSEHDVPNTDTQRFESYAFLAACGMVDLSYEELSDAKNSGVIEAVNPSLVREVAEMFVGVADWGQRDLTGSVNRNAMSHTRARGAVRSALLSYPAREYVQDVREWREKLAKVATTLLKVAASL